MANTFHGRCYRSFRYYNHRCSIVNRGVWWVYLDDKMALITPSFPEALQRYKSLMTELHNLKELELSQDDDFILIP